MNNKAIKKVEKIRCSREEAGMEKLGYDSGFSITRRFVCLFAERETRLLNYHSTEKVADNSNGTGKNGYNSFKLTIKDENCDALN